MAPQITRKFLILVSCVLCFLSSSWAGEPKFVRVAIIQDTQSLNIKIKGFYELFDSSKGKILYRDKNLKSTVVAYKKGIIIGGVYAQTKKVFIKPIDPESIIINERKFRGNIELIKKNNHLLVVNYIDLEDYIKGILYHEASHYWPVEALKAQAIACRTYAVYQMGVSKNNDYDVTNDIYSQVYGGKTSERYRTNKIVEETKGLILTYNGKVLPAYYHATCAGHTEDASLLWDTDIPSLKGVACPFCKESPHFNWHYDMPLKELEEKLNKAGHKISDIKGITIVGLNASGRITKLRIVSDKKEITIPAKDFRNIVGVNILRSTNFQASIADTDVVFEGIGWGHGAGLCQWGAYFMAKQGKNYQEILKYYYPGTDVKTLEF